MQVETILVPLDFSPHAERALDLAIDLASKLGTKTIHLLHIHHPPPIPTPLPGSGPSHQEVEERVLEDAAGALEVLSRRVEKASVGVERAVYVGSPAEVICAQAAVRGTLLHSARPKHAAHARCTRAHASTHDGNGNSMRRPPPRES